MTSICNHFQRPLLRKWGNSSLLELAEEEGLAFRWSTGPRRTLAYAAVEQPEEQRQEDSKRAVVEALLAAQPGFSTKETAEGCGVSPRYVRQIRRALES